MPPYAIAEPAAQAGDDFVHRMTVPTGITAVLDQGDVRLAVPQDMIALIIDSAIEPDGSCMDHTLHPPCACAMLMHGRSDPQKLSDRFPVAR